MQHLQKGNAMTIERMHTGERASKIVKHNGTVYLSGQVGTSDDSIQDQTQQCLDKIDALLAEAGSSNKQLLQVTVWLSHIGYFADMNGVWNAWVPEGHAPARACSEANLARKGLKVEILVTAAY